MGASPIFATLGILVATNYKNAAERVYNFYASRVNPGWATPTTIRIVGGGWAFLGSMLLLPEVLKVIV